MFVYTRMSCKGRLGADAKITRLLYFGAIIHTKLNHDYIQKNRFDCRTHLTLTEPHMGLALKRLQAEDNNGVSQALSSTECLNGVRV